MIFPMFVMVTLLVFLLLRMAGDPIRIMFASRESQFVSETTIQVLEHRYGFDQPPWIQYAYWLGNTLRGDLGYSFLSNEPVATVIGRNLWNTMKLMAVSEVIIVVLAITLGIATAVRRQSKVDNLVTVISLFGWSMPFLWVGLMSILFFSVRLGLFPSFGASSTQLPANAGWTYLLADQIWHLALPVGVISLGYVAYILRLTRGAMIDVLDKAYITTARAKGLSERVVIYKHAFRNAILPVITVLGLDFGRMFAGVAVLEIVFAYPGMGNLLISAAESRDFPVVLGTTTVIALMVLIGNFVADIAYAYADPRIRY